MNPPTTSIDDLPPEMIRELFHYLRLKDLAACSLVNKRWYSIYVAFKLHSLAITSYEKQAPDFDPNKWYHSNRQFREAEVLFGSAMFGRLVEKPLLSNLRQLTLYDYPFGYDFDLNELNRFEKLVHLEIRIRWFSKKMKVHLNLPKLEVLAFQGNEHCLLFVDCPKLSTLLYSVRGENANLLDVKHPETIRKLETNLLGPNLTKFKGVECLVTKRSEAISKATLALPRLRELRCNRDIEHLVGYEFGEVGTIDRMKRTLNEFLREAKRLKGSDFRFTFAGFQLTNVKLEQIDFGVQVSERTGREWVHNECVYMKNYHLIEPGAIDFVQTVSYDRLLSNATGELPRCFSQKFTDIRLVQAGDVNEDPDQLLRFLNSLESLESLDLVTEGLSQEFYDRLPASACSLSELQLYGDSEDVLQLNFQFISEFSLSRLEIWQPISLESSTSLANSLGGEGPIFVEYDIDPRISMKKFPMRPYGRENHITIRKEWCSKFWEISIAGYSASNPKEIVNYFEPLQNSV